MKIEEISLRLKNLRIKNNLTQEELASKLFITRQAVSRWEKGKSLPDYSTIILLSKLYKTTIDDIIIGNNKKENSIKDLYNNYISQFNKKKKIKILTLAIVISFIIIFSIYNMVLYYGKVNIYKFNKSSDNVISCENAYLIVTNDYSFFKTCDIHLTDENELFEYQEYYIQTNSSRRLIIGLGTDANFSHTIPLDNMNYGKLIDFRINDEYLDKSTINHKNWDLIAVIKTNKNTYEIKLDKEKLYSNNGIINDCQFCKE